MRSNDPLREADAPTGGGMDTMERHPLRLLELKLGLTLALACVGVIAAIALVLPTLLPHPSLAVYAPSSLLPGTSHHCALCGLTSAMYAMAQGDLVAATSAHPAGPMVYRSLWALTAVGVAATCQWIHLAKPYLFRRRSDDSL